MISTSHQAVPAGFMQLVGHPLRWRLLCELGRSDRRVGELTRMVGEPQNLVSYHLGKLRGADLVRARRSSADRRDTYYTVDLTHFGRLLTAAGAAVHPGLRLSRQSGTKERRGEPTRILFLCTGNSARSQMAEALAEVSSGGGIDAHSAGSEPKPLHPHAVEVMKEEFGIDVSGRRSKHVSQYFGESFDRVITLCDRVREVCPEFPGPPEMIHWSMADPGVDEAGYPAFQRTAFELKERIDFLVVSLDNSVTEEKP